MKNKKKKKNNNNTLILMGVVLALILVPIILLIVFDNKLTTYKKLNISQLESMIKKEKDFILYINRRDCSHCLAFKPKLNQVIQEYQVEVYGIDVYGMTTSDQNRLSNIVDYRGSTPTTAFIVNGKEKTGVVDNRIVGNQSKEKIISMFKSNGYITE